MKMKLLPSVVAVAFVVASGASWAQVGVGGNFVAKYPTVSGASKNKKVTRDGVGGNFVPVYPKSEHLSKNTKVTKDGVGGNFVPVYPKSGTH